MRYSEGSPLRRATRKRNGRSFGVPHTPTARVCPIRWPPPVILIHGPRKFVRNGSHCHPDTHAARLCPISRGGLLVAVAEQGQDASGHPLEVAEGVADGGPEVGQGVEQAVVGGPPAEPLPDPLDDVQ